MFADHRVSIEAHASQAYAISAGQVTRWEIGARESGQVTEVVLIASSGPNRAPDVDWYAMDGVILVANHPETISIRVAREHSDAVLLAALRHGWSVKEVMPDVREPRVTSKRDAR